jgi:C-terminal processing protease CtpA/Prc
VLDIRRLAGGDSDLFFFLTALNQTFPKLLEKDLQLASTRHRMYSGYPTQTGGAYGGYYSAFVVQDGSLMKAGGAAGVTKPMAVIINQGTVGFDNVLSGLQSAGLATIIREGEEGAASTDEDFGGGYRMPLPDGVNVVMRTTEFLNPDGSSGFHADRDVPGSGSDTALQVALTMVREDKKSQRQGSKGLTVSVRKVENPYSDMAYPSLEYRLLALFRFWNVIEYFYPYKHLIDTPWDSVLPDMIPEFEAAADAQQYHLTAARLATRIQDTHGFVSSKILMEYFGTARPPLEVKTIQGKTVITHIFTKEGEPEPAGIKVGDVILAVDSEEIGTRRLRLGQYFAHSTPQALRWRVDGAVLGGAKDTPIKLRIQAASGKVTEVTLTRNSSQRKAQREGPVYTVLPSGFGYIDLERLTTTEVDTAFETVKDTPAVIFDIRGYPKGVFSELGKHLAAAKTATSRFGEPRPSSPDSTQVDRLEFIQFAEPGTQPRYKGKVVALINAEAISQSEHTCLWLETTAGAKFVGSATNGANGDVTQTVLPGGIVINFSGHDVRHADGSQLQRLGIQPAIKVEPTIAGIRAGKDEVLEKAIEYLKQGTTKPAARLGAAVKTATPAGKPSFQ